jgi:hypothetical protein
MHASKQRTTVAWHFPPSNPLPRKSFAKGLEDGIQIPKREKKTESKSEPKKTRNSICGWMQRSTFT